MRQNELSPAPGSKKSRKRVGRGDGSGHGTYSGRGCKGQKSRAGFKMKPGFEGGQLPLIKRLPQKRGFVNIFRIEYNVINLDKLNVFESRSEVTPETLLSAGLVKSLRHPVKILADGDINHPLVVKAHKFSIAAKAKIEAAVNRTKEALKRDDLNEIKSASEALTSIWHQTAAKMYQTTASQEKADQKTEGSEADKKTKDESVDADFEVVN